jgi:hypothetical protein
MVLNYGSYDPEGERVRRFMGIEVEQSLAVG